LRISFHSINTIMAGMYTTYAFGKPAVDEGFQQISIERNLPGDDDVQFDVIYCGVCHSDVHVGLDQLGGTIWPFVGGHELAGVVTAVGKNVSKVSVGDHVGVGCIVDSCLDCSACQQGEENYCKKGLTGTYNAVPKYGRISTGVGHTLGGYSGSISVNEHFIVKIPDNYPLEAAGPILCAGITMYSPLSHWGAIKGGMRVGIIGIGGLGQMGVRLAAAMGNEVTAISTSERKKQVAIECGATNFIISRDPESMQAAAGSLDLILNTVSAPHEVCEYVSLLDTNGTIVQLGLVTKPHSVKQMVLFRRKSVSGSCIGGMPETQACIDFCAEKNIQPQLELITSDQLDDVYQKLNNGNEGITRYVLDIKKSRKDI